MLVEHVSPFDEALSSMNLQGKCGAFRKLLRGSTVVVVRARLLLPTMTNSCAFDFFYETKHKDGSAWPEAYKAGKKWIDINPDFVTNMAIVDNRMYS